MKLFKALLITLTAVLFTGCYTQLQYSQQMNRITDEKETETYAGNEENREAQVEQAEYSGDEYIPVYFKDYEYAEMWAECGCNPYKDYHFYDRGFGYSPYSSWHHSYRPYYGSTFRWGWSPFNRWSSHHPYFGSSFAFSIHWGSPYYHSFFGSPFYYSSFYHGPFGYGLRPTAFNYFYFYNNSGYGYYDDDYDGVAGDNRRYGPRSIGTSRVNGNSDRVRTRATMGRSGSVRSRNRSGSTVRTRSVGTSRTRGTVNRGTGSSVRSRSGNSSSRTRSRGNLQQSDNRSEKSVNRSRSIQQIRKDQRRSAIIRSRINSNDDIQRIDSRAEIRNRLKNKMAPKIDYKRQQRERSSFFQRIKGFFDSNSSRFSNQNSNRRVWKRSRSSSSNRSTIRRSSSSNNRSSVKRSRSSSNRSRSTGSSSRSRSSSSSGDSDSSDRSRSRGN